MDIIKREITTFKSEVRQFIRRPRENIEQLLATACVLFTALMLWKTANLYTGTDSPVVVVLSGSMEPAFYRGDILFLMKHDTVSAGDIVVFKVHGRDIPIVHRTLSLHANSNEINVLTKGDNNDVADRGLYSRGQKWLDGKHLVGTVLMRIPKFGIITIILNENRALKWSLISMLIYLVLSGKG
ncbi:signal peptidase, putative [Babesia bigemina]|uniref:Signal peptidase complex catalytic subunit SEC11 n=1 Tax=Babesia bigemina TaxID=5866 RepID=A0A061DDG4_BABBI|nr:signal peptidase, putative [Babesia bigemina]CDR96250.1 signal peptidase, putative [Babesia bigemina]|eukprot:XP_012768436.1 signal peptidase, putative [Babesia bigemina]